MILKVTHYGRPHEDFVRMVDVYEYDQAGDLVAVHRTTILRAHLRLTHPFLSFRCSA
jgi:hypothetical protein